MTAHASRRPFVALAWITVVAATLAPAARAAEPPDVHFGSKKFTESVILGEMLAHLARTTGASVEHHAELGGTRILWSALLRGEIDAYPEYTGTIRQEILASLDLALDADLAPALAEHGILASRPLGFNNTYAIGMRKDVADSLHIRTISDLVRHPDLKLGFTNEFMDRGDGWPALRDRYRLPHRQVRGLDHDIAYRGLEAGSVHAIDLYSTDAEIRYYDLRVLEDDLAHFPEYDAVILYRADLPERAPEVLDSLLRLPGSIDAETMVALNARAKIDRVSEVRVAADFLEATFPVTLDVHEITLLGRLATNTREHLTLFAISLFAAIAVGIPLGVVAGKQPRLAQTILGATGLLQTIPALAILVLLIGPLGLGAPPAIVALFLYSLLPIVRNTHAGLVGIPTEIRESAMALGLPARARLRLIELPMASRSILAGIKTAAVINVGTATLAALVGAGGYGQPIFTGIRLDDSGLILQGALPAAALALLIQGMFEWVEKGFVPRGLRLPDSDRH